MFVWRVAPGVSCAQLYLLVWTPLLPSHPLMFPSTATTKGPTYLPRLGYQIACFHGWERSWWLTQTSRARVGRLARAGTCLFRSRRPSGRRTGLWRGYGEAYFFSYASWRLFLGPRYHQRYLSSLSGSLWTVPLRTFCTFSRRRSQWSLLAVFILSLMKLEWISTLAYMTVGLSCPSSRRLTSLKVAPKSWTIASE
jgi:hypothetical protein